MKKSAHTLFDTKVHIRMGHSAIVHDVTAADSLNCGSTNSTYVSAFNITYYIQHQ